ncbi:unnamed protein product [Protopolystoma xenopodis]|uniref:Uncharacterized protein n=1 Tax=Protopolystoma xenopodis TaxID=117903 RepID=A0A3S5FCK7_9PLAT|nr:unnamed protein product [Protopolystoma xenopodis]
MIVNHNSRNSVNLDCSSDDTTSQVAVASYYAVAAAAAQRQQQPSKSIASIGQVGAASHQLSVEAALMMQRYPAGHTVPSGFSRSGMVEARTPATSHPTGMHQTHLSTYHSEDCLTAATAAAAAAAIAASTSVSSSSSASISSIPATSTTTAGVFHAAAPALTVQPVVPSPGSVSAAAAAAAAAAMYCCAAMHQHQQHHSISECPGVPLITQDVSAVSPIHPATSVFMQQQQHHQQQQQYRQPILTAHPSAHAQPQFASHTQIQHHSTQQHHQQQQRHRQNASFAPGSRPMNSFPSHQITPAQLRLDLPN